MLGNDRGVSVEAGREFSLLGDRRGSDHDLLFRDSPIPEGHPKQANATAGSCRAMKEESANPVDIPSLMVLR